MLKRPLLLRLLPTTICRFDRRSGDPMSAYSFWKRARPLSDSVFNRSFIMTLMNRERARLAKRIRELERKLGRPHRYLKQCGAVQYV